MAIEIIRCGNCGKNFPNNPDKHRHQEKRCPHCLTPYTKTWLNWKPKIKERLGRSDKRWRNKLATIEQRATKSLRGSLKRTPTDIEIRREMLSKLTENDMKKWEKLKQKGDK